MSDTTEKIAYRIPEAVAASGLSRATLYRMAADGDLKLTKARGRTLIRKEELEALLARLEGKKAA